MVERKSERVLVHIRGIQGGFIRIPSCTGLIVMLRPDVLGCQAIDRAAEGGVPCDDPRHATVDCKRDRAAGGRKRDRVRNQRKRGRQ